MIERDSYLDALLESSPTSVRRWLGDEELRGALGEDFAATIAARVTSPERLEVYARLCPVASATPSDYRLREIRVLDDATVLAGIHFRNLEVKRPFIGVYATSRELSDTEILAVSARLEREFLPFAARRVWWWSPEQRDLRSLPGAESDRRLIVGKLAELLPAAAALPESLLLRADVSGQSYSEYVALCAGFAGENPEWGADLATMDRSAYDECAAAGGLLLLEEASRVVGVIAARPGMIRGIRAWEMMDEILAPELRGRRYAPLFQRCFLDRLDRGRSPLVMGTIAAKNAPSRRTALGVGRRDVGGWVFVPTGYVDSR